MRVIQRGGVYNRVADPAWKNPLDTTFAKLRGGRWNAPGAFGALYLNATIEVAVGNVRRTYENEILSVFDLVNEQRPDLQYVSVTKAAFVNAVTDAGLRALHLPATYPAGSSHAVCRSIGALAYAAGRNGIACRTADATSRTSVIVDGEELAIFDRALTLVKATKRVAFSQWYPLPGPPGEDTLDPRRR